MQVPDLDAVFIGSDRHSAVRHGAGAAKLFVAFDTGNGEERCKIAVRRVLQNTFGALRHAFVDQDVCVADARGKRKGKNAQCADREHAENGTHDIEHGTAHGRDGAELFPCRANL